MEVTPLGEVVDTESLPQMTDDVGSPGSSLYFLCAEVALGELGAGREIPREGSLHTSPQCRERSGFKPALLIS